MKAKPSQNSPIICLPAPVVAELGRVVSDAIRRHASPLGGDELMTPEEVARALRLPTRYVRGLMADGKIPSRDIPEVGLRCTVGALRDYIRTQVAASRGAR